MNISTESEPLLERRRSRVWPVCYSTAVAVMASFSFGYILAYSSPALTDLQRYTEEHRSFTETIYQDIFGVSVDHVLYNIKMGFCRQSCPLVRCLGHLWLAG